jgi:NhaP-type Na+/H+ or K+/H+ antiporter
LLRTARRRGWIAGHWTPIVPALAALAAFGIADALGGSGFIAAFVGGAAFGRLTRRDGETTLFTEQVGDVLNAATFFLFGALALGGVWHEIGATAIVYALLSLTVVRMVPVAIAMLGSGARRPTIAFLGWFGPRGLASIVFAVVVVEDADLPHTSTMVTAVIVTVALSVLLHGVTAAPLARRYGAWSAKHPTDAMEHAPTPPQRWRLQAPRGTG